MRNFEQILERYITLLEQDAPPPAPPPPPMGDTPTTPPTGAQPPDATAENPAATEPNKQPSSVGFAVITQIILDALRVKTLIYPKDRKYSDNSARTSEEAWKYLDIITRNLPLQSQQKAEKDVGEGGDSDLDELNIVDMVDLGLKALFFVPKLEEAEGVEYSSLANIVKVTTQNALEIYNQIRDFLSTR